jgi:hypothetical protein
MWRLPAESRGSRRGNVSLLPGHVQGCRDQRYRTCQRPQLKTRPAVVVEELEDSRRMYHLSWAILVR